MSRVSSLAKIGSGPILARIVLVAALVFVCGCESGATTLQPPRRDLLSETGLYADAGSRRLAKRVLTLEPTYPLWSDGATKRRYLLLPEGSQIDTQDMNDWRFPVGTKIWKEFALDGRLIETRLLEKDREPDDDGWFQMAYVWTDDEQDAIAAPKGLRGARGTTYEVPDARQCNACHHRGGRSILAISALQLSATADGAESPSITTLRVAEALSVPPTRTFVPPGEGFVRAALGYFVGNCAHCHDRRAPASPDLHVFMDLRVEDARPEDTTAYQTLIGQPITHFPEVQGLEGLVIPGRPEASLVYYRMNRRDDSTMPPLLTNQIDVDGVATIEGWIRGLPVP
jgi:hypothetical protein